MKFFLTLIFSFIFISNGFNQSLYYPPITGNEWQTISPKTLGWCDEEILNLYDFLAAKDTKAFIVLKDGKIVLEKYFGTFTQDSTWYWASAGKSMISYLVGISADKGLLDIDKPSSTYLGKGWSSLTSVQEERITVKDHLSMTTGLDDGVPDDNCEFPSCLTFLADAGSRWAYYNAPYRRLHDIVSNAAGMSLQTFMNREITFKTGIAGLWIDKVLYSKPRSMARFGLLALGNGKWGSQSIINDQKYLKSMSTPSQDINPAYGYLWWLNGQATFMLPTTQFRFTGSLIPSAPADMYCALGKNDQKIYIIPSHNMVIVRMGNDGGEVTGALSSFDNQLWDKLNQLSCTTSTKDVNGQDIKLLYENPSSGFPTIAAISAIYHHSNIKVVGLGGEVIFSGDAAAYHHWQSSHLLSTGLYILSIQKNDQRGQDYYKVWIK